MITALALGSFIIIICIAAGQFLHRFGVPSLIMFLVLGVLAGSVGPWGYVTFHDYEVVEEICSVALVFIIFYGGFGTNWKTAKPVVIESVLFSTVGVLITAGAVMLFVHFALALSWAESFLIWSVVSCIDAASIFSILRTEKLSLKFNAASVLEIEGGCNDLPAYMLTVVALIVLQGQTTDAIAMTVVIQLVMGVLIGVVIAVATVWLLKTVGGRLLEGMSLLLVIAVAVLSYAVATNLGGNGYLATYLCGIIMGNSAIPKRSHIVTLFDSIDWLAQIIIFFLLGFMTDTALLPAMIPAAVALTLFLTLVARPAAVFAIFPWFTHDGVRNPVKKGLFISWAGIRGAASLVFVFLALASDAPIEGDLFSLIFIVAVLSIVIQGTLFPTVAEKLDMVDNETDYKLSFNDFQEQSEKAFMKIKVSPGHAWVGMALKDLEIGQESLIVLIKRAEQTLAPRGNTIIMPNDILVVSGDSYSGENDADISVVAIDEDNPLANKLVSELGLPSNTLIVSVEKTDGSIVTPKGWTKIHPGDVVTLFTWE